LAAGQRPVLAPLVVASAPLLTTAVLGSCSSA
jgi:hypothetical protein